MHRMQHRRAVFSVNRVLKFQGTIPGLIRATNRSRRYIPMDTFAACGC